MYYFSKQEKNMLVVGEVDRNKNYWAQKVIFDNAIL